MRCIIQSTKAKEIDMSYPYGPESYPTIEKLETDYFLDTFRTVLFYEMNRLEKSGKSGVDSFGLAFARALVYATDWDDQDLGRFLQDLFAVLEDKVISSADECATKYAKNAVNRTLLKQLKKERNDPETMERARQFAQDGDKPVETYYDQRIDELKSAIEEFCQNELVAVKKRCGEDDL